MLTDPKDQAARLAFATLVDASNALCDGLAMATSTPETRASVRDAFAAARDAYIAAVRTARVAYYEPNDEDRFGAHGQG